MSLATEIRNSVLDVLTDFGHTMTLHVPGEGTYDASTGNLTDDAGADYTATGIVLDYKDADIDGTRVLSRDRKCIIAALGLAVVPQVGDQIVDRGTRYSVIRTRLFEVDQSALAYVLQVRNA